MSMRSHSQHFLTSGANFLHKGARSRNECATLHPTSWPDPVQVSPINPVRSVTYVPGLYTYDEPDGLRENEWGAGGFPVEQ
jgi:hypothetical protein